MEQLTAVVQETTFRNEENGYTVLEARSGRQDVSPFVTTSVWNTEVTAVAIAVDADGNFGEPSFQVFTCRKADAAPASEFDEYNK